MAKTTYKGSGVDIDAGNLFVELIKPLAAATLNKHVLGRIGGFSGAYELPLRKYKKPVLVAATDGVGTKLKLAFMTGRLDTVGIDLVAMNVNDLIACGADPLFFLDYIATSKLDPAEGAEIVKGIVEGCREAGCALLGGETAEMPGFYGKGEFDLAGFAVGIVDKDEIIDGSDVLPGDAVIGLASSGLHSNGYSLARKVLLDVKKYGLGDSPGPLTRTLAEELLEPTRIYVKNRPEAETEVPHKRDRPYHGRRAFRKHTESAAEKMRRPSRIRFMELASCHGAHQERRTYRCG